MLTFPSFTAKSIVTVFAIEGHKFSLNNSNLIVKDKEDEVLLQYSCHKILSLWIIGNCTMTTALLTKSKHYGFSVFIMGPSMKQIGMFNSGVEGNFLLRQRQYTSENTLQQAKSIITNKIANQIATLKNIRSKSELVKQSILKLVEYQGRVDEVDERQKLLGLEGVSSRVYFSSFFEDNQWRGRKPRTKHDITNVLMDMGYTYLFYFIENLVVLYGFDLYKGVYHQNFYQRKSLICDLVEPFRVIIDKKIKKAYGLNQINFDDFKLENDRYILPYNKNKTYSRLMIEALLEYQDDLYFYCRDYYRFVIRKEAEKEFPYFDINNPIKKE